MPAAAVKPANLTQVFAFPGQSFGFMLKADRITSGSEHAMGIVQQLLCIDHRRCDTVLIANPVEQSALRRESQFPN